MHIIKVIYSLALIDLSVMDFYDKGCFFHNILSFTNWKGQESQIRCMPVLVLELPDRILVLQLMHIHRISQNHAYVFPAISGRGLVSLLRISNIGRHPQYKLCF